MYELFTFLCARGYIVKAISTYSKTIGKLYKIIKIICEYISIFHTIHENEIELVLFTNKLIKC